MRIKRSLCLILAALCFVVPLFSHASRAAKSNEEIIYDFLINDIGMNTAQACGVLANIYEESRFNPTASYMEHDGYESFGLCQWHVTRLEALKSFCEENGYDYKSVTGQMNYLKYELNTTEKNAYSKIRGIPNNADGAYTAGYNWTKYFGRGATLYYDYRGNLAKTTYWAKYGKDATEKIYATITPGTYYIKNNSTGLYLTVPTHKESNGTDVATSRVEANDYFKMSVTKATYGYVIKPLYTQSAVLNVYATIVSSGKNVTLYSPSGNTSQEWYFDMADGGYSILSVQSDDCALDLSGSSAIVKTYKGDATQKWSLIPSTPPSAVTPTVTAGSDVEETVISWESADFADLYEVTITGNNSTQITETQGTVYTAVLPEGSYSVSVTSVNSLLSDTGNYKTVGNSVSFTVEHTHVHDFSGRRETVIESTCTAEGLEKIYCSGDDCGEYITSPVPVKPHDYSVIFVAPGASTNGLIMNKCKNCTSTEIVSNLPSADITGALISPSDIQIPAYREFTLEIEFTGFTDVSKCVFTLSLPSDRFKVVGASVFDPGIDVVTSSDGVISVTRAQNAPDSFTLAVRMYSNTISYNSDFSVKYDVGGIETRTGGYFYPGVSTGRMSIVPLEGYYGDADSDGDVTMKDVLLMRRYIAGIAGDRAFSENRADVNGDGIVDMKDVLAVRRFIAGLDLSFPQDNK